MRRLTSFTIALAAAMSPGGSALATGIFFDVVPADAISPGVPTGADTASCPAPCYQVRVIDRSGRVDPPPPPPPDDPGIPQEAGGDSVPEAPGGALALGAPLLLAGRARG